LKPGEVAYSKVEVSKNTQTPELRISSPVSRGGAPEGLVVLNVDWSSVGDILGRDAPGGLGGYFFLVNSDGFLLTHPKYSLKDSFSLLDSSKVGSALSDSAKEMLAGKQGVCEYSFEGVKKFMAFSPLDIGGFKYSVAGAVPVDECLALVSRLKDNAARSSSRAAWLVLAAFAALSVLAILAGTMLGRAFASPLRGVASLLKGESEQVRCASSQISDSSASLADGASKQAASIEEISASLTEISSMLRRSSESAAAAEGLSKEADSATRDGMEAMERMSSAMARIRKSSEETSKIAKTIEEIAFQTNLLALNAAVEAARAGEAGKGFAVVAEEVRSLAKRSADAAREASRLIDESKTSSSEGVDANSSALARFKSIDEAFAKVRSLIGEMASSSKEQSVGIDQISKSVLDLENVTQGNAAGSEETAAASRQLALNAEALDSATSSLIGMVEGGSGEATGKLLGASSHGSQARTIQSRDRKKLGR